MKGHAVVAGNALFSLMTVADLFSLDIIFSPPPLHCMPFSFHSFVNAQIEMDILKNFELNEVSVTAKIQTDNRHMSHGRFQNRFTAVEL